MNELHCVMPTRDRAVRLSPFPGRRVRIIETYLAFTQQFPLPFILFCRPGGQKVSPEIN
jgi:hypothetical protein